jgi:methylmalonyl-CoA/ethylmalonyl-CoA epimerase
MKIKRIEHVAIAVKNIAKAREIFEDKLGLAFEYEEYLPQYSTRLAMFPVGQTYIELLESDRPESETSKWVEDHGEGLFHICLEVEDIESALAELKSKGVKLIDQTPRIGHANSRIAFLDPKSTNDVLIELVELSRGHASAHAQAR